MEVLPMTNPVHRASVTNGFRVSFSRLAAVALLVSWLAAGGSARATITLEPTGNVTTGLNMFTLQVRGQYAFATSIRVGPADLPNGFQVFDISDPSAPFLAASLPVPGRGYHLKILDDYAYFVAGSQFYVVDISDPLNPEVVASPTLDALVESNQLAIHSTRVYMSDHHLGIHSMNIADPLIPTALPMVYEGPNINGVAVADDMLLAIRGDGRLFVIDVADPDAPEEVGHLDLSVHGFRVAAEGHYAYVPGDDGVLSIVDFSDPTQPMLVADCAYQGVAVGVRIVGRYALLALEIGGVAIVDVIDPANPVCHPRQPAPQNPWEADVYGEYLVTANFPRGISVYRIHGGIGACCAGGDCWETVEDGCDSPLRGDGQPCDMFSLMPTHYTGCLGDLDGTGRVSPSDRGFIAANFGTREADSLCMYDLDGNGVVNSDDRLVVSSSVGQCIPLPDHQNGSGLNQGAPDLRFRAGQQYMGFATACEQVDCGDE
jgi:hypothetical protein